MTAETTDYGRNDFLKDLESIAATQVWGDIVECFESNPIPPAINSEPVIVVDTVISGVTDFFDKKPSPPEDSSKMTRLRNAVRTALEQSHGLSILLQANKDNPNIKEFNITEAETLEAVRRAVTNRQQIERALKNAFTRQSSTIVDFGL